MDTTPLLRELIKALQCLPGVGPKTAQRMAFSLLQRDRQAGLRLAVRLQEALEKIAHCRLCRTYTEQDLCAICNANNRDHSLLCVVESPADVAAIEQASAYSGVYYVLLGRLSPIDGVTPEGLGLPVLEKRLGEGHVKELIVATGTTMEGEATAFYLKQLAERTGVGVSRIAYGIPIGGELEYLDGTTLSHALASRTAY